MWTLVITAMKDWFALAPRAFDNSTSSNGQYKIHWGVPYSDFPFKFYKERFLGQNYAIFN